RLADRGVHGWSEPSSPILQAPHPYTAVGRRDFAEAARLASEVARSAASRSLENTWMRSEGGRRWSRSAFSRSSPHSPRTIGTESSAFRSFLHNARTCRKCVGATDDTHTTLGGSAWILSIVS